MAERFLDLRRGERAEILQTLAVKLGRTPIVLEKDVWVCWTLAHLFAISGRQPMAFKGGTSLSKVYSAIARFSEDLDVTLDCRALVPNFDPFSEKATTSSRKNHRERLVKAMAKHIREVVDPALRTELEWRFQDRCQAELEPNAEKLWIYYESALPPATGYIQRNVLIEFGGVNSLIPSESKKIEPYLAGELPGLDFPVAQVDVLRPERTFWEKATLVHAECGRGELRPSREKLSRHWYDLSCLAEHDIGHRALADRALLIDRACSTRCSPSMADPRFDRGLQLNGFEVTDIPYQRDACRTWRETAIDAGKRLISRRVLDVRHGLPASVKRAGVVFPLAIVSAWPAAFPDGPPPR